MEDVNWWGRWRDRYAKEIEAFSENDASISEVYKENGLPIIEAVFTFATFGTTKLIVGFSPHHPFCRPTVSAPDLQIGRHQHPISQVLCLLTQEGDQWNPQWLVADMIAAQVANLEKAKASHDAGDVEAATEFEEEAGDPISAYFAANSESASYIAFDPSMRMPKGDWGRAEVALAERPLKIEPTPMQGLHERCLPVAGQWFSPKVQIPKPQAKFLNVPAVWMRSNPSPKDDPEKLYRDALAFLKAKSLSDNNAAKVVRDVIRSGLHVFAICYKDEVLHNQFDLGWIYLIRQKKDAVVRYRKIAPQRIGSDNWARLPASAEMKGKLVLLAGCGAIGSFVAMDLARAGVGALHLIDSYELKAENSVRWPLGRWFWGLPRVKTQSAG